MECNYPSGMPGYDAGFRDGYNDRICNWPHRIESFGSYTDLYDAGYQDGWKFVEQTIAPAGATDVRHL